MSSHSAPIRLHAARLAGRPWLERCLEGRGPAPRQAVGVLSIAAVVAVQAADRARDDARARHGEGRPRRSPRITPRTP